VRLLAAIRRLVFGPEGPSRSATSALRATRDTELYGHDFEHWDAEPPAGTPDLLDAELPWELREDDGQASPPERRS
jgi:hypothetical protein